MKKLTLLLALVLALSCLLIACDNSSTIGEETTMADTTAANTSAQVTVPAVGAPTEEPTEAPTEDETEAPSTKILYTVIVKDQNGDVVEGAAVQMCDADTCKMPTATNAEGVATFNYDPSNYYVTVQEAPDGYTCDPEQKFYFEGDATEMTVVITKN